MLACFICTMFFTFLIINEKIAFLIFGKNQWQMTLLRIEKHWMVKTLYWLRCNHIIIITLLIIIIMMCGLIIMMDIKGGVGWDCSIVSVWSVKGLPPPSTHPPPSIWSSTNKVTLILILVIHLLLRMIVDHHNTNHSHPAQPNFIPSYLRIKARTSQMCVFTKKFSTFDPHRPGLKIFFWHLPSRS